MATYPPNLPPPHRKLLRSLVRRLTLPPLALALALAAACASGADTDDADWSCTDTPNADSACHCQPSRIAGNVHIVDHCDRGSVPEATSAEPAECCKQWLVLNGRRERAFYCSCYLRSMNRCDVDSGDELVERCP